MHGDGKLDDQAIRNELVTLVLAGHETTANLLTWAWYMLARYPLAESTLHRELDRVLGDRPPTYADVPQLTYTARIVDETLRMYPPAAAFARRPLHDVVLGGYAVPAMTSVFLSPYVLGRDPRFFEEPSSFRPDRWEKPEQPKLRVLPVRRREQDVHRRAARAARGRARHRGDRAAVPAAAGRTTCASSRRGGRCCGRSRPCSRRRCRASGLWRRSACCDVLRYRSAVSPQPASVSRNAFVRDEPVVVTPSVV